MIMQFSQQYDLSLKMLPTNKKIKKNKSKTKYKKLAHIYETSLLSKNEAKYIFELTCFKDVEKNLQIEQFPLNKMSSCVMGHMEGDIFSNFFKIVSLQQSKHELIVKCLPFNKKSLSDIKKDFPFVINLDYYTTNNYHNDTQRTLECIELKEVPQEKFEFIINPDLEITGCNRIVNNFWLKMFGINQDMMIHTLLRNSSFPFGWNLDKQFIQNQISNTNSDQNMRLQLTCYNGSKFDAQIQLGSEIETNSKNQFLQRYTIYYFINREQLSLSQVEQNFRQYFKLKDLSQELMGKFIEKTNKQCQIKRL